MDADIQKISEYVCSTFQKVRRFRAGNGEKRKKSLGEFSSKVW